MFPKNRLERDSVFGTRYPIEIFSVITAGFVMSDVHIVLCISRMTVFIWRKSVWRMNVFERHSLAPNEPIDGGQSERSIAQKLQQKSWEVRGVRTLRGKRVHLKRASSSSSSIVRSTTYQIPSPFRYSIVIPFSVSWYDPLNLCDPQFCAGLCRIRSSVWTCPRLHDRFSRVYPISPNYC